MSEEIRGKVKLLINVTGMTETYCDKCTFLENVGQNDRFADCTLFQDKHGWYSQVKWDKVGNLLRNRRCINAEKAAKDGKK